MIFLQLHHSLVHVTFPLLSVKIVGNNELVLVHCSINSGPDFVGVTVEDKGFFGSVKLHRLAD